MQRSCASAVVWRNLGYMHVGLERPRANRITVLAIPVLHVVCLRCTIVGGRKIRDEAAVRYKYDEGVIHSLIDWLRQFTDSYASGLWISHFWYY